MSDIILLESLHLTDEDDYLLRATVLAFREIRLNAVVHKDYSGYNPIQISVYQDKKYIRNDGIMPTNLNSSEKLFQKHSSKPYNSKLAEVFFKSGMIEAWGRGFDKIKEVCAKYDAPLPEYEIIENGIMVLCKASEKYLNLLDRGKWIQIEKVERKPGDEDLNVMLGNVRYINFVIKIKKLYIENMTKAYCNYIKKILKSNMLEDLR